MRLQRISKRVADRLEINEKAIHQIAVEIFEEIKAALMEENPVSIQKFGEWYFDYRQSPSKNRSEFRLRTCKFRLTTDAKSLLNASVRDIGITTSRAHSKKEGSAVMQKISRDDIPKLRKAVNELALDRSLRLRKLDGQVSIDEISANLTHMIETMPDV